MILTRGRITSTRLEPESLAVDGWAAPLEAGAITGVRLHAAGRWQEDVLASLVDRPGRDVPSGAQAFALRLPLDAAEHELTDRLLMVVPQVDGRDGLRLVAVPEARLPLPQLADLDWIFGTPATERTRRAVHAAWPVGFEYLGYIMDLATVSPDAHVLEVGCGVGRVAYALSYYLAAEGRYSGFDPMPGPVRWASQTIGARFPNFRFDTADIRNPAYHPVGGSDAATFEFPYESASFDCVILLSVFTHLPAPVIRHYLGEIARVLKPTGRCLCSWYFLNEESEALLGAGLSRESFEHPIEDGLAQDPAVPEQLVAIREAAVHRWLDEQSLRVQQRAPGRWCGRERHLSYQDILVLARP